MANTLAERIRTLQLVKIQLVNPDAGSELVNYANAVLTLDDAADAFVSGIGESADLGAIGQALVSLADVFDDTNLSPDKEAQLNDAVAGLLNDGTPDQIQLAKELFAGVLTYGKAARGHNEFFNTLLSTIPPDGGQ